MDTSKGQEPDRLGATQSNDPGQTPRSALDATFVGDSTQGATQINEPGQTPSRALDATYVGDASREDVRSRGSVTETADMEVVGAESKPAAPAKASAPPAGIDPEAKPPQLGDFKLLKKLGQGGMGEVYLAHQVSLDRDVALKILSRQMASKPNFVERFYREARTMARLDHPHIVRGYAVGEEHGFHYVAMELIDGKSMQDWLNKLGKLSVGDALHVAIRAADALQHAHDISLIHRDIKPDNMLVTSKGVLKVSDLGLAKNVDEDLSMTQSGTGLGTPHYMPPEQARDAKHVDQRSDIYALGGTLYHFLSGELPFKADSVLDLILLKEKKACAPIRKLNPQVPERLELMIDKMLAKDPKHRYQNCAELIRDLESLGLANATLSFMSSGGAAGAALPAKPRSVARDAAAAPRPSAGTASAPGPRSAPVASAGASEKRDQAAVDKQIWYIKHANAQGRVTVAKLATSQVIQILKAGQLDIKAKASKTAQGEFRPLAAFPEFEAAVKTRLIKAEADKKSETFQGMYKQIEQEDLRRRRWGWLKRYTENVKGLISLAVYLAVLASIGYGLYRAFPFVYRFIAEKFNLS